MHATRPAPLGLLVVLFACGTSSGGEGTSAGSGSSSSAEVGSGTTMVDGTTADATTSATTGDTGLDTGSGSETGDPEACWTDLAFGEQEVFYSGFAGGSEGIAFGVDGLLYVTTTNDGDGTVWRLDARASASEHALVPYALGLAPRADGSFVVASIGVLDEPDGAVHVVDPDGVPTPLITTGIDSPNFVTIAPDGSALVSDDVDTRVFRITADGELSVVIAQVESPNGMAYSPDGAYFYVASTFTPLGQLTRYEVDGAGLPIEATAVEILQLGPITTPDGIAVDADGMVYVAANVLGQVWRVDGTADGVQPGELVAEGLGSPASLAFGRGPGFDPCSIYLTQLFGSDVVRVAIGVRGAALYL